VPTDAVRRQTYAIEFVLRGALWGMGLLGLLRLNWTEAHVLLPLTRVQAVAAGALLGPSALPVEVTLACSGADALALCLGAVLAYPVRWRTRLTGAAGGVAVILGLNTLRLGTLGRAAASPAWFHALHVYVWPAVLLLAIAAYAFAWMHLADRPRPWEDDPIVRPAARFVLLTLAFLLVFIAASPFYLQSSSVLALAGFTARMAAVILGAAGVGAYAAANVLWTPTGGFQVTQECIVSPVIPVYLAGVCAYGATSWQRTIGIVAAAPLFIALAVVRLLMVALPGIVGSPLFFVHAFFQLLVAVVVVSLAAVWRYRGRAAVGRAVAGVVAGALFVSLLGPLYTHAVTLPAGAPLDDPQGAIAFLPAFQVGLYLALWIAAFGGFGWSRFLAGLALLGFTQTTGLIALHLANDAGLTVHVRDVRGWAIAGPLLVVAAVVNNARPNR